MNFFVEFVKPPAPPTTPPHPPTCAPCPACPTTPLPPPPEFQCPVCTCIPVYQGSYGSLKADEQSSYSCSRAHLPQIFGISRRFNNYFGVSSCPTLCFADCGHTYHCCDASMTTAEPNTCFPFAARVTLENGKSVTMSELQVGDTVQTGIHIWRNFPFLNFNFKTCHQYNYVH